MKLDQLIDPEYKIDIQKKISIEQCKILYRNLIVSQFANFICATIVMLALYPVIRPMWILIWYGLVILVTLLRLAFWYFYYRYHERSDLNLSIFIVGIILSASLWGFVGSILMPEDDLVRQMVVIIIIAGITSGGIQSLQASLIACIIYVFLIIMPLTMWLFLKDSPTYFFLGIVMATYMLFIIGVSYRNHRLHSQALKLYYENLELIHNLSISNKKLQKREQDTDYINTMNKMLQTCSDTNEAYEIIKQAAQGLFSDLNGGLCILDNDKDELETVKQWGANDVLNRVFDSKDCWALREGYTYSFDNDKKGLICNHFTVLPASSICIPLIFQHGTTGLINFSTSNENLISEYKIQLAHTFAEVIKLSLANIQLREKLHAQAIHDPLTGLFNRRYLNEILPRELTHIIREKSKLSICMIDLDDFKNFNTTYGHEAGDKVLKLMGEKLSQRFRGGDIACRFGGEEFIVMLSNADAKASALRMENIKKEISQTNLYYRDQVLYPITLSVGIAEAPRQGTTMEDIIRSADNALYQAKKNGKDRIEIYNDL